MGELNLPPPFFWCVFFFVFFLFFGPALVHCSVLGFGLCPVLPLVLPPGHDLQVLPPEVCFLEAHMASLIFQLAQDLFVEGLPAEAPGVAEAPGNHPGVLQPLLSQLQSDPPSANCGTHAITFFYSL